MGVFSTQFVPKFWFWQTAEDRKQFKVVVIWKILARNLLIYKYLHCVRSFLWCPTTLDTQMTGCSHGNILVWSNFWLLRYRVEFILIVCMFLGSRKPWNAFLWMLLDLGAFTYYVSMFLAFLGPTTYLRQLKNYQLQKKLKLEWSFQKHLF